MFKGLQYDDIMEKVFNQLQMPLEQRLIEPIYTDQFSFCMQFVKWTRYSVAVKVKSTRKICPRRT